VPAIGQIQTLSSAQSDGMRKVRKKDSAVQSAPPSTTSGRVGSYVERVRPTESALRAATRVKIGAQRKFDSLHKSRCTHDSLGVETFNFKRDEGVVIAVSFVQPGIRTTFAERLLVL
jgi:hypothetical protein